MSTHPVTAIAESVDRIAWALTLMTAFFLALVVALIVYFCIKYRAGSRADRSNRQAYSWPVEIWNFSSILVVGLFFFVWSARLYYREYSAPRNAVDLYVLGKQWMWMFQYPDGPRQIGAVKVPLGRPVRLLLTSDDVIHSFYVPQFRIKQDALPGRYTSLWFAPRELGKFTVLCTEYCGTSHSRMSATIEVVTPEAFAAYLRSARPPTSAGAAQYRRLGCAGCHETQGQLAPGLAGIFGRRVALADGSTVVADENYLRRSLFRPAAQVVRGYRPIMPTFQGQLPEADVAALIQYLKSLPKENKP
jgi:cytochrome c oxidase subunit 2